MTGKDVEEVPGGNSSPSDARTAEAVAFCEKHGIDTLMVGGSDTHGIMRGKRIPIRQFEAAASHGVNICDVFWVIDVDEGGLVQKPHDATTYFPTERNGYPDIRAALDLRTLRRVPWHARTGLVLADFTHPEGSPIPISPRHLVRRLVERFQALGLEPQMAVELEFYVLQETEESLLHKRPSEIEALSPRPSTYGVVKGSQQEPFAQAIREAMEAFEIPLEACNPETGPGQFEINLHYESALDAVDHAFLFKNAVKEIASQQGYVATFMAKPRADWAGNSCHVHMSALDAAGNNVFAGREAGEFSETMGAACAGILATFGEFTALQAPTVNSYRRYLPYSWAGDTATWGVDNRSTGIRAVSEGPESTRLEHRQGGGDANPYLAAAGMLAGALYGIENELTPPPPHKDDVYALELPDTDSAPPSLADAVRLMAESKVAYEYLGADFVDHFLAMKQAEVDAFALTVTDWELARYAAAL